MHLSDAGRALIKRFEGFRGKVYRDVAGIPTIGYGHKLLHPSSFPNGIDEDLAEHILACDIDDTEAAVERLVRVPVTQGQFDALVDFVFNLGGGRLAHSTLLTDLNAGRYDYAREQLLLWDHAGGKVVPGLQARRQAEFEIWGSAPADPAQAAKEA